MKNISLWVLLISLITATNCSAQSSPTNNPVSHSVYSNSNSKLTYKLIPSLNNTWGYDIFKDNKKMIHQPIKPGSSGLEGFKSKANAQKVAELVIRKIKKGEMPPTVSEEEMRAMKVL